MRDRANSNRNRLRGINYYSCNNNNNNLIAFFVCSQNNAEQSLQMRSTKETTTGDKERKNIIFQIMT